MRRRVDHSVAHSAVERRRAERRRCAPAGAPRSRPGLRLRSPLRLRSRLGLLAVPLVVLATLGAGGVLGPSLAGAQSDGGPAGRVLLVNAYAGQPLDVLVAGRILVADLQPGQSQDLTPLAGQLLRRVEIRAARTTTTLIGPLDELLVPVGQYRSWTVHQRQDGSAVLTAFEDDRSPLAAGRSRLTVRHVAPVGPADLTANAVGAPSPALSFAGLVNGDQVQADVGVSEVDRVALQAPGGGAALVDVSGVSLRSGEQLVVYVIGGLGQQPLSCFSLAATGLATVPTRVESGFGPLSMDGDGLRWPGPGTIIAALGLSLAGGLVVARQLERRERHAADGARP